MPLFNSRLKCAFSPPARDRKNASLLEAVNMAKVEDLKKFDPTKNECIRFLQGV
jgi:hypothetical protein